MNPLHLQMAAAIETAREALPQDVPVGAVLYRGDEVIARACNRRERDFNPVGHAEVLVLIEAAKQLQSWRLLETTLVVTLEPCPMCASAIIQARIPRVIFGAYDPVMGACGSRYNLFADSPNIEVIGGVQEPECRALLHSFFREPLRGTV